MCAASRDRASLFDLCKYSEKGKRMHRKGFLVFSHACFLTMLSRALLLGLRDAPWELPFPKASNGAADKKWYARLLCGKGMREFIIISFHAACLSPWTGIFPRPGIRITKDWAERCFLVNKYRNEGPSMTGGTRALIGGPFVFPHMALYTWCGMPIPKRLRFNNQPLFMAPRNFPRAASEHLITCAQPVRKGCQVYF